MNANWDRLVDLIELKCRITNHGTTAEPLEDKPDLAQKVKFLEFERAGNSYRLELVTKPRIVDRKTHYRKSIAGSIRFENIYDPADLVEKITLYAKRGDEWQPAELESLGTLGSE